MDTGASFETLEAFTGSREILGELGRLSPQAAQYHHILTAFSDAIGSYREQAKRERRASQTLFVDPILSVDAVPNEAVGDSVVVGGAAAGGTQLPTPEITVCDESSGPGDSGVRDEEVDPMLISDFLTSQEVVVPDQWPMPADDELMLRLFWDGYTTNLMDPTL